MILLATAFAVEPAAGSNRHFTHTVRTEAPAEAIWRLWTDPATWPAWDTELESARLDGDIGLGAEGVLVSGGRETRFAISLWEPKRRYAFTTRFPLGSLVVTRTLDTTHGTRFTHDVRFRGVGGAVLAPILGPRFRRALPEVMQTLEALARAPEEPTG